MSEMLIQVCAQVMGNDAAIALGARDSVFELNVMMPMIAWNLLESLRLLSNAVRVFTTRCAAGLEANIQRCGEMIERSLAMCTALVPAIGYDAAAAIAKEAFTTGKTVREVALAGKVCSPEQLAKLLDPAGMTAPRSGG
jgi:fumarate hydratase class II